jgi:uncharacterized protein
MHFARTLRAAGLPVGPGKVIDAVAAVRAIGITDRNDFYWTLHAVLVNRPDQRLIFDQAFHVFWRNPDLLKKMMGLVLPELRIEGEEDQGAAMARRLAEALHPNIGEGNQTEESETELDAAMTFSDREQLREMDFEKMSLEELARAKAAIARLRLPVQDVPTRRFAPDRHGARADLRATMRAALRSGGLIELKRKSRRRRPPPLVVLCDISGSMEPYARAMLQLLYCASRGGASQGGAGRARARRGPAGTTPGAGRGGRGEAARAEVFTFATRLTRMTSELAASRPGTVLARAGKAAPDWSGGTRIGASIKEFNDAYGCRGLARGAVVLIISDGWETGDPAQLGTEMARLSRVAYRIVWANPRTKSPRYRPEVGGMAAAWPYCDAVVSAHSLNALDDLIVALGSRA